MAPGWELEMDLVFDPELPTESVSVSERGKESVLASEMEKDWARGM